jgi:hypothetical protein
MTNVQQIAETYINTWNERDSARRDVLIANNWSTPTYVDPLMAADGAEQLSQIISAVHDRFPGFAFSLISKPDGHGDYIRFSWGLGPVDAEPIIEGSDVVRLKDGRLGDVIGFLDKVPTQA